MVTILFELLIKMKNIRALLMIVAIAIFVSACNTPTTPTMDVMGIQNTVIAATFTRSAETYAALPTLTIIPPTETSKQHLQPQIHPLHWQLKHLRQRLSSLRCR
jgi:hypothetical protein